MAEIDLIPPDYRDKRRKQSMAVRYGTAIVIVNVLMFAVAMFITHKAALQRDNAAQLRVQNLAAEQQEGRLQTLLEERAGYDKQWSLLRGLRAGGAISDVFPMIDRAVGNGDLWFDEWSFRRAGITVENERRGVESGLLVLVDDETSKDRDLSVETHMSISGHALDHQALSRFVRVLFEQTDVADVRVRKTAKTDYANGVAVSFDLTVVLNSAVGDS